MLKKKSSAHLFEVALNWIEKSTAVITSRAVKGSVKVAAPPGFPNGGVEGAWSPEHLFLGSIISCYMTTFMHFATKAGLNVSHLECSAIGTIDLVDGRYVFVCIDIYPRILTETATDLSLASETMHRAEKYCLITHSISAMVHYHGKIEVDPYPRHNWEGQEGRELEFSMTEAKEIGDRLGINWEECKMEEFRLGLKVEREQELASAKGTGDIYTTAGRAWSRLKEIPDYYSRLEKMETASEK